MSANALYRNHVKWVLKTIAAIITNFVHSRYETTRLSRNLHIQRISRLPTWLAGEIMPSSSMRSIKRAARL